LNSISPLLPCRTAVVRSCRLVQVVQVGVVRVGLDQRRSGR
jgi:hypothetical protein